MEDQSMTHILWPQRRVLISFAHETSGDLRFQPMIAQAMLEYIAADPMGKMSNFSASNGVQVSIAWPKSDAGDA